MQEIGGLESANNYPTKWGFMKTGEISDAKRWALDRFDEWVDITGVVSRGEGYYYELQSVIEDAVEIGAGLACGASRKEILKRIKE